MIGKIDGAGFYCIVGEHDYEWENLVHALKDAMDFPQILVAEYPYMHKVIFEVKHSLRPLFRLEEIPILPGSALDGMTGEPLAWSSFSRTAQTKFVRLPNIEEVRFYEKNSRL